MEGLNDYLFFWGLYLLAGLIGFWCWGRMAFWVKDKGLFYHLYSAVGAILIFTPVPVAGDLPIQLAPGFIVVVFNVISLGMAGLNDYVMVFASSTIIAFTVSLLGVVFGIRFPEINKRSKKDEATRRTDPTI